MQLKMLSAAVVFAAVFSAADAADRTDWFRDAQYGLFIHWGCYAVPAKGEWYLNKSQMDPAAYRAFSEQFKPEKFDAAEWAKMAKRWGMKYVVFTTRHHDGYAMWDSSVNPWNAAKVGPRRDILGELVPALRKEGLRVGYYYSPANWSNPDYAGYRVRGWPSSRNWKDEVARKCFNDYYQAEFRELMEKYGVPDLVWWDGCLPDPKDLDAPALLGELRGKYPNLIWNNRHGDPCDFHCAECEVRRPKGSRLWEACMTLNRNWGFCAADHDWKSPADVIDMLLACRRDGGNLLINVGPKPDGTIPAESVTVLDEVGRFLEREGVRDALGIYPHAIVYDGDSRMLRRVIDKAEAGGEVRIAVMGGSITEGARAGSQDRQWGSVFAQGWRELFPKATIVYRNCGIGATGSEIGAFRYERDVASFKPDLVVVEFGVNDQEGEAATQQMRGIIRHALRTKSSVMLLEMAKKNGTNAQKSHLVAARECGAPVISYRDAVTNAFAEGTLRWDDIGADGVHPNRRGHALAGELLNLYVRDTYRLYRHERTSRPPIPDIVQKFPFERGSFTPAGELKLDVCRGFEVYEESRWGKGLASTNAGDRVEFSFDGRSAAILYRRGKLPLGKAKVTVDGEELATHPDGRGDNWWWHTPSLWLVKDKPGRHKVVIETLDVGFKFCVLMVEP